MTGERVRLRFTWVVEWDANPADYDTGEDVPITPERMAALDQQSLNTGNLGPHDLSDFGDTMSLTVEVAS